MTNAGIFPFVLPFLVMSIGSIFLCFYLILKKKRQESDLSIQEQSVSSPGDQVEQVTFRPVPSSLQHRGSPSTLLMFDPKLTKAWSGGSRSPYEMFPVTLPLAPQWITPTEPTQPPSSPTNQNYQNPPRTNRPTSS